MSNQKKTFYEMFLEHISDVDVLKELEKRLHRRSVGIGIEYKRNLIVLMTLEGEKFNIEGDLSKLGIIVKKMEVDTKQNNNQQISCCLLRSMSKGIRDYAYMKNKENPDYNLKLLTVWQIGIFEGHVLLFEALRRENKVCHNCSVFTNDLHKMRRDWENKFKP